MTTNKDHAVEFLQMIVAHKIKEAYAKHIGKNFVHHNAQFKSDAESLMNAMIDAHTKNPNITIDIKNALEDEDLVAIHLHVKHNKEESGYAIVHLFRFLDGKIAELWDVAQEVPKDIKNEKGMF
ncbi:nuclear transport factor 2 family protein [Candidatus Woesearchaeota archaeon]|nr:MAG: nuclear transport factor 2 family protein [Candidatus Woesearchaeota archaeon]